MNKIIETFVNRIADLGYDRFSITGDVKCCTCHLWRSDETISSVCVTESTLEATMNRAIEVAEFDFELRHD